MQFLVRGPPHQAIVYWDKETAETGQRDGRSYNHNDHLGPIGSVAIVEPLNQDTLK